MRFPRPWSALQRRALVVLLALIFVYAAARIVRNSTYVSNPQPQRASRADELEDRIDPNSADVATLAVLPGLGEKRAQAIVDFRSDPLRSGRIVFQKSQDLLAIRGIGVNLVQQIEPFLIFPANQSSPATRRS